jgi:hypothetical protein
VGEAQAVLARAVQELVRAVRELVRAARELVRPVRELVRAAVMALRHRKRKAVQAVRVCRRKRNVQRCKRKPRANARLRLRQFLLKIDTLIPFYGAKSMGRNERVKAECGVGLVVKCYLDRVKVDSANGSTPSEREALIRSECAAKESLL